MIAKQVLALLVATFLAAQIAYARRQMIKSCIGKITTDSAGDPTWCSAFEPAVIDVPPVNYKRFVDACPQYREAINREGLCCDQTTFEYYERVINRLKELGAASEVGCRYNTELLLCGLYCAPGQRGHWQVLQWEATEVCLSRQRLSQLRLYIKNNYAKAWFDSCKDAKVSP